MLLEVKGFKTKQINFYFYLISLFFFMASGIFWIFLILSLVDSLARFLIESSSASDPFKKTKFGGKNTAIFIHNLKWSNTIPHLHCYQGVQAET